MAGKTSRFMMHFTPTSSSWLNRVEHFFADLIGDVIRAGSFASVNQLIRDVKNYLAQRNTDPKPYIWRAEGTAILAKIKHASRSTGQGRSSVSSCAAIESQDTSPPRSSSDPEKLS